MSFLLALDRNLLTKKSLGMLDFAFRGRLAKAANVR
jgi:hypothetical protein